MQINGKEYTAQRSKLKTWLELDSIRERARETDDSKVFAEAILSYISVSLAIPISEIDTLKWSDIVTIYLECLSANVVTEKFPILRTAGRKNNKATWEYDGRTWYVWAHLFAKSYGWSLEYVENLDPVVAIALMQEISIDEQLGKEWEWGLTEIAYPYNSATKKSEFKELPRPDWMQKEITPPAKLSKIPMSMIPVGNIVRYSEKPDERT